MTTKDIAELVLKLLTTLVWPLVTVFFLVRYREALQSLMAQGKVKFTMAGVTVETTLAKFEEVMTDNLRDKTLLSSQWESLQQMAQAPIPFDRAKDYEHLRPLRDAGLIWALPKGHLGDAKEVVISPLGKLLLNARQKEQSKTEK